MKMATSRGENDSAQRKSLSKNTLQMKFMQRSGNTAREELEIEANRKRDASHWVLVKEVDQQIDNTNYHFDSSYIDCENLLPIGRMSFLKFNPAIEKIHKKNVDRARFKVSEEKEKEEGISDDEMAKRYESLVDTIAKKFQAKRKEAIQQSSSDSDSDAAPKPLLKRPKLAFRKPKED